MTRPSRFVLGILLTAGLSAAPSARAADPDKLIPSDADTVVVFNLKQVFDSEIAKKALSEELKQQLYRQDAKNLVVGLGIDPLKDVEKVTLCYINMTYGDGLEPDFLLILRGGYDAEKMFKAAEAETRKDADKFAMIKDGKTLLFKYTPDNKKPPMYATVIDTKTVIVASEKKFISAAVKAADAGKAAPMKKELAELFKRVDDKTPVFWLMLLKGKFDNNSLAKSPLKVAGLPIGGEKSGLKFEELDKALPKAESAILTAKIGGAEANFELTVTMKDEDAANDMRNAAADIFAQLKPLAQLAALLDENAKPLPALIDATKITSKNKDTILSLKISGGDLATMLRIPPPKKKDKK